MQLAPQPRIVSDARLFEPARRSKLVSIKHYTSNDFSPWREFYVKLDCKEKLDFFANLVNN